MKLKLPTRALLAATLTAGIAATALATPVTVVDEYYGGDDHNHGDVIGSADVFDVSRAELSQIAGATAAPARCTR